MIKWPSKNEIGNHPGKKSNFQLLNYPVARTSKPSLHYMQNDNMNSGCLHKDKLDKMEYIVDENLYSYGNLNIQNTNIITKN